MTTKSQTSVDPEKLRGWLEETGHKLTDCGTFWRTQALHRGGTNRLSIQIYKNTGVWRDFGGDGKPKPLAALIKVHNNGNEGKTASLIKDFSSNSPFEYIAKDTIKMDKIYPETDLNGLFPNRSFYLKRGISEETQAFFKSGLAGVGKMYRRIVFPIYNEHQQIVGYSGRKIDEDNPRPKWKQLGKKRSWVYPAYIPAAKTIDEIIDEKEEAIIVESIGDAMAFFECGVKNLLVSFGLDINAGIISYLSGKSLKRIIIALNNDEGSDKNNGLIAAITNYMALSKFFDLGVLEIRLPPNGLNDYGLALEKGCNLSRAFDKIILKEDQLNAIVAFIKKSPQSFNPIAVRKFLKLCNDRT